MSKFDPNLDHLTTKDFYNVYQPNSDTFAFVDALEKDLNFLLELKPSICYEIGYFFKN